MRLHTIKTNADCWRGRRYFLNFDKGLGTREITNELYLLPRSPNFGINVELGGDHEGTISCSIRIPKLIQWYFTMDCNFSQHPWWQKLLRLGDRKYDSREWGIDISESFGCVCGPTVHIKFGKFRNEYRSSDPKWLSFYIEPQEIICGKHTYTDGECTTTKHRVMIPGGRDYEDREYDLVCKEFISTWTWPRFKKPLNVRRFDVSCEEGVKHPGKGTCDYNCEETSFYGSTGPANSKECAIQNFIDNAVYYRTNYPL